MFAFLSAPWPCASFLILPRNHFLCLIPSLLIVGLSLISVPRLHQYLHLHTNFALSLLRDKLKQPRKMQSSNLNVGCNCKLMGREEEEEVAIVMKLRKKLRREQRKRKRAVEELEREREASAWASEEAMEKIMMLEREKAVVEREARQYREAMEKKHLHHREVIHYLRLLLHTISHEMQMETGASRSVPMPTIDEIPTLGSSQLIVQWRDHH